MSENKEVYIDQVAVAAVDARIKQTKAMTAGLMSSWARPMEGLTEGPMGKVTAPKPQEAPILHAAPVKAPADEKRFVVIPLQGMKAFKALLPTWFEVEVRLTPEQAKAFLEMLQQMPTPKKMYDAKAIFNLMESLGDK